jgi:gamma-glutamyltranspeptidase/glutathione hydrolase
MGTRGLVASAHPLASLAGLRVLMDGGNAVDAAVAVAAALNVCEPFMSGVAGVGVMLLHLAETGETRALDFSGRVPYGATPDMFTPETQQRGIRSPLVPGNLGGWLAALDAYGAKSRGDVFGPAIEYAEGGFPVSYFAHGVFSSAAQLLNRCPHASAAYLSNGNAPAPGEVLRQPDLARTFRAIVEEGAAAFYQGEIARSIADFCAEEGGLITLKDLENYKPAWQDIITTEYRGYTVATAPPRFEGFQMLETLNILEAYDLRGMVHNSPEAIHLIAEAIKIAVADRIRFCGDTDFTDVPVEGLISKAFAADRRRLINPEKANAVEGERWMKEIPKGAITAGNPREFLSGLTTHFVAVDPAGNVVSVSQTLGSAFGSARMVKGTGVTLNNGVNWVEIDPACDTPNRLKGGKRPSIPIAPLQLFRDGKFFLSIGTPGSYGLLQTTVQMLLNVLDFGANLQEAIEAPRFRCWAGATIEMEERIPPQVRNRLAAMGHDVQVLPSFSRVVGGGHGAMIHPASGARLGGADPRRDGYAIGF